VLFQQARVVFMGFLADTSLHRPEPLIEILVQANLSSVGLPIRPPFVHLFIEVRLRLTQGAVNCPVVIIAFVRLGIATQGDANHPGAFANCDDLPEFSSHGLHFFLSPRSPRFLQEEFLNSLAD